MSTVKQQAYSTYVICVPSVLWIEKKKVIGGVKGGALKLDCIYRMIFGGSSCICLIC